MLGDPASEAKAEDGAQAGAEHQHRDGGGTALRRVEVGDHRHRRRGAAGLADGHADACQHQEQEAAGQTAEHGHRAPGDAGQGDDRLAADAVGQPAEREAEQGVEHREGQPGEQADLGIGDAKLCLHRLDEDRHQLPVDVVEHVDDGQHPESVVGVPGDARR
ncbi:hypothetical protein D3C84_800760 [compost metagenome]